VHGLAMARCEVYMGYKMCCFPDNSITKFPLESTIKKVTSTLINTAFAANTAVTIKNWSPVTSL
jgi:hypothetical protein